MKAHRGRQPELEAMRSTMQRPRFRSNSEPDAMDTMVGLGGSEVEAMRAQEMGFYTPPVHPTPSRSWFELADDTEEQGGGWPRPRAHGQRGRSWGQVTSQDGSSVHEFGQSLDILGRVEGGREESLEPERTMEGIGEDDEETNSLQAFRAVEQRLEFQICLNQRIYVLQERAKRCRRSQTASGCNIC